MGARPGPTTAPPLLGSGAEDSQPPSLGRNTHLLWGGAKWEEKKSNHWLGPFIGPIGDLAVVAPAPAQPLDRLADRLAGGGAGHRDHRRRRGHHVRVRDAALGTLGGFRDLGHQHTRGYPLVLHRRARTEQHPQKPTTPVTPAALRAPAAEFLPGALAVPADRLFLDYVHRHPPVISGNRPGRCYLTCSSTFANAGSAIAHLDHPRDGRSGFGSTWTAPQPSTPWGCRSRALISKANARCAWL